MKRPRYDLKSWAAALLNERVPLAYGPHPQINGEVLRVAKRFCSEDPWAISMAGSQDVDVEELCTRVVSFARELRYEVLDEPGSPYATIVPEPKGPWRPST